MMLFCRHPGGLPMRRLICCVAALVASASGLFAQSFNGTWQGGLKIPQAPNGELRIVIKIEGTDKDKLAAEFYSIDQNPTPLKAESVKTSGQGIKINIPTLNGTYDGTLSSDGNTINGTWSQGPTTSVDSRESDAHHSLGYSRASSSTEDDGREREAPIRSSDDQAL